MATCERCRRCIWWWSDRDSDIEMHCDASREKTPSSGKPSPGKPSPGKVGLQNIGNTCFMNAGLQCLGHVEPLRKFFLSGQYKEEVNVQNPLGSQGNLSDVFATLLRELWQPRARVHNPRDMHQQLRTAVSRSFKHLFENNEQQDAQEFINCMLDGLHEELARKKGDEFAAEYCWSLYADRTKSFLVDTLQGQQRSRITCTTCECSPPAKFESFLYLSLPVNQQMTRLSDALEKFLEEEQLDGWKCEKCDRVVEARKKIDLTMLPDVLVLHLNRFSNDRQLNSCTKIDSLLSAPELMLDLSQYCCGEQRNGALYDIACIANHIGEYGGGHYTATCRVGDTQTGIWYHFDDSRVHKCRYDEDIVTNRAYVIFLVRRTSGTEADRTNVHMAVPAGHCSEVLVGGDLLAHMQAEDGAREETESPVGHCSEDLLGGGSLVATEAIDGVREDTESPVGHCSEVSLGGGLLVAAEAVDGTIAEIEGSGGLCSEVLPVDESCVVTGVENET